MNPRTAGPHRLDPFETGGHPVHSRALVVDIEQAEGGRVRARGTILDVRKHGWVPTGAELQTPGLLHHMSLDALVDAASRRIERFEPSQQVVAFEASERTAGDSCRDPIHRMRALEGATLDAGSTRRLRDAFGGPLGCSHLLTLAQLVLSLLPAVLEREDASEAVGRHGRRPGERLCKRVLFLDGFDRSDGQMEVGIQLTDVYTAPFAAMKGVLDRLDVEHGVRAIARVEIASMTLSLLEAAERVRTRSELGHKDWESRGELLAPLVGRPAMGGLAPELLRRFGGDPERHPLLDALLNLGPALVQCLATRAGRMIERWTAAPGVLPVPKEAALGGFPDSCWIWRAEGRMARLRQGRIAPGEAEHENAGG